MKIVKPIPFYYHIISSILMGISFQILNNWMVFLSFIPFIFVNYLEWTRHRFWSKTIDIKLKRREERRAREFIKKVNQ